MQQHILYICNINIKHRNHNVRNNNLQDTRLTTKVIAMLNSGFNVFKLQSI